VKGHDDYEATDASSLGLSGPALFSLLVMMIEAR
jgi:hypothetical protein